MILVNKQQMIRYSKNSICAIFNDPLNFEIIFKNSTKKKNSLMKYSNHTIVLPPQHMKDSKEDPKTDEDSKEDAKTDDDSKEQNDQADSGEKDDKDSGEEAKDDNDDNDDDDDDKNDSGETASKEQDAAG